jgi:amidohydrolase
LKDKISNLIDSFSKRLKEIASKIFDYSEVGYEEFKSSEELAKFLEENGFEVQRGVGELPTAIVAKYGFGKPVIAFVGEYDALPEIGHACGHNMIGTISAGAAVALMKSGVLTQREGTIMFIGSPAEERGTGKRILLNAGVFRDVDAALMIHPSSETAAFADSFAVEHYKVEFFGKPAHAASKPHEGVNALDAMNLFFTGIALARQQLPERIRLHGIVKVGGQAFNIIPEYTMAEIGIRTLDDETQKKVTERVKNIAKGAALMTGCEYKMELLTTVKRVLTNEPIGKALEENFKLVGETVTRRTYEKGVGSTDMGDVTYEVPGVHGYICVTGGKEVPGHTHEFAQCCNSQEGYQAMIRATKALAMTGYDLLTDPELLKKAKEYFEKTAK